MTNPTPPWLIYPSLTEQRLGIVARLLADVRHETVLLHDAPGGDNNWSLGCRVYVRTCAALLQAVETYNDWLSVIEDAGLHFVFAIGGVPLRFYKGEAEKLPLRTLLRNFPELHAQQLALFGESKNMDREILRLAVETDHSGEAEVISLVRADERGTRLDEPWPIAYKSVAPVAAIVRPKDGVVQPAATVLPFKEAKREEEEEHE